MLGKRSPQRDLFRPDHTLRDHVGGKSFYALLAKDGQKWFRDEDFVDLYREGFGRPGAAASEPRRGLGRGSDRVRWSPI